ncbi:hypothetical protein HS088_TW15G00089 [Tripterygium wilfordii]|uniref:TAF1C beta-propeller domain-containing protein n=1 Tax=Tripterygium wilfordii TaxID=458696 RepID=A0A7J7CKJ4_TRIWF|nr:uncharacterized protein LOC120016710 [Tripterygium wilfordii]KAF5734597.1 hypothetical protein HS088_TW15G00089 [Tripterygium wilfordii]
MESLAEELKPEFPIGKVFDPPLLLRSEPALGPLLFNPEPKTLTQLFSSPSLAPPLLSPHPRLSLSRYIFTTCPSVPPSTASSIDSIFGPQNDPVSSLSLSHNRLQLLEFNGDSAIVFFPTGENLEQIGFLVLSVKDGNLKVDAENEFIFRAEKRSSHRILRILVNPVVRSWGFESESSDYATIGYLMACTMYSVDWYSIKLSGSRKRPFLSYLGCKRFKTCAIAGACWSPHLPEECLVLLESGALFLFDMESDCSIAYFKGTRLRVSWDDSSHSKSARWLGCEFSWHGRILIVARSDAVFLVDVRADEIKMTCLAKIEMLGMYSTTEKQFLAFSKAVSNGFQFVLASDSLLVIYDVRRPLMPILQWEHNIDKPCFIDVFRLSELRSQLKDATYEWATNSGFCIALGSFWNDEFKLFCCGHCLPACKGSGTGTLEISNYCKSLYAWELPSNLLLSGRECPCGSCILREDFAKDALPTWVDWQQKKEIVLGFGLLGKDLTSLLSVSGESAGFMVIRLMSSGKLESQRYYASWKLVKKSEVAHRDPLLGVEDHALYDMGDEVYKFPKRYKYLKLNYLNAYLNGDLSQLLASSMNNCVRKETKLKEKFSSEFHEILSEKLEICGFSQFRTSPAATVVFDDISVPTSICEVASKRLWAELPMELLQLAFSSYSEFRHVLVDEKKVSLEFLTVPDLPQLPPFFLRKPSCRSSKWSRKVEPSDTLVGPVLPLPVLQTIHECQNGCPNSQEVDDFSPEAELDLVCEEVRQVAKETSVSVHLPQLPDDAAVSLDDDTEEVCVDSQKTKPFISYHPAAFECSENNGVYKDGSYTTLIAKVHKEESVPNENMETVGLQMFDDLCLIKLKFDTPDVKFGVQELKAHNALKRKFAEWQKGSKPYQEFCTKFKLRKPDS